MKPVQPSVVVHRHHVMLSAVPSSGRVNTMIRITGIGDRDRLEWLIRINGIRMVGEVARHDAFQLLSLLGYALVQTVPHLLFDLREFGPHAFAHGLPLELELAAPAFRADMREAEEVKSSQPLCPCVRPIRLRVSSERDQTGFLRVQFQFKLCQPGP